MTYYKVLEQPNIDDPNLVECCACIQNMRGILFDLSGHVLRQLRRNPVTIPNRVTFAIINRIMEGSLSVELLCIKNRIRDASVLILNIHELRLDLQYISLDISRANEWIDHTAENRKPWRVDSLIKAIFTDPNRCEAERDLYRQLSMTKHGNPAGDISAFPIAAKRDKFILGDSFPNHPLVGANLSALGENLHLAGEAADTIWSKEGLDTDNYSQNLKVLLCRLSKFNEAYLYAIIEDISKHKSSDKTSS